MSSAFDRAICEGFKDLLRAWIFTAIFGLSLSCGGGGSRERPDSHPASLLPSAPPGWQSEGGASQFAGAELSDYINGGAEVYLAYGFKNLAVREFRNSAGARMTVEIYEMNRAENAFGVFSADLPGENWDIGADSSYSDGLLRFWKGLYFVRIMCYPPDSSIEAAIEQTAVKIEDAVTAESRRPGILSMLPEAPAAAEGVCYFHRQTSLNNIRFLSDENIFHLSDEVEALTWEQRQPAGAGKLRQIVLRYPSESTASEAFRDFGVKYLQAEISSSPQAPLIAPMSDGKFAAAGLRAAWLFVILDADSAESAARALAATEARLDTPPSQPKGG